ncbi:DUF4255 domain-containing protein [Streptomyces sp. NPDC029003]|uniref:DUF4255 domain-containing protein n=1 Tax=Streptomyces sp. NPDC029003 TaxID=3155125 RepID=UPI0033D0FDCB
MSNSLALAAVTTTIRYVLQRALDHAPFAPDGGCTVTTKHPSKLVGTHHAAECGINVYCFQVAPNAAGNAAALPSMRSDGSLIGRPAASLDLHYLISGYGDDQALVPQRLLGVAVGALTATAIIPRKLVRDALDHSPPGGPAPLKKSDLDQAVELVKLSATTLSLEQSSQLWGLFSTPYLLSVTYLATVAEITCDLSPHTALPVLKREVSVRPAGAPRLDSVAVDEGGAAVNGAVLVLRGSRLLGPGTRIAIGPAQLDPAAGTTHDEVRTTLTADVPAGVHTVQVTHHRAAGSGGVPQTSVRAASNAVPIVVRPTVTAALTGRHIVLTVNPPLRKGQRVTVLLSRHSGGGPDTPSDLTFEMPPVKQDATMTQKLSATEVEEGTWLVRVRVDGADSLPELVGETFGEPLLAVPAPPP